MDTKYEGLPECFYRISAKAFIYDDAGRFILCKENSGKYDIPGGGIDYGETPNEALTREIMEEMGLEVTWISEKPLYCLPTEALATECFPKRPLFLLIYEVKVKNLDFTPSNECQEIAFFTVQDAIQANIYNPNIQLFKKIEEIGK